ncbi:MAG: family 1 glycosylhydrolase, partial [Oscillospiraceae bacterium]|nr:family 1 glycosylhydrolase [Oscillospiraceae bacterium]
FMDIISGHSGFSKRYGFVYVNRDEHDLKDMNRYKKKSFGWYQKVIATNGESLNE